MKSHYKITLAVLLFFLLLTVLYFRKFFFGHLLPIPLDIITGVYYPWRDYSWGYTVAVPVKNALPSDIVSFIYPFRILAITILKSGNLPFWNQTVLTGTPLLADFQTALFYPTTLIYYFLRNPLAWSVGIFLQTFLCLLFMYLFLCQLLKSKLASTVGAGIFTFGAFETVWLEYNTHGHVSYWLPFELFVIEKYRLSKKPVWLLLLTVATTLQLFAGYPQMMVYSLAIVWAYLGFVSLTYKGTVRLKDILLIAGSFGLGFLASAIQLLPALELLKLSNRYVDQTVASTHASFLPIQNLVTFLIPDFFGNPATLNYWGIGFYDNFAGYFGIASLILMIYSFYAKQKMIVLFFAGVFIFSLLLVFQTPLSIFLNAANIGGLQAAVAARALFITNFSGAVLAAFGFDWLASPNDGYKSYKQLLRPPIYLLAITIGIIAGIIIARKFFLLQCQAFPLVNGQANECSALFLNLGVSLHNVIFPIVILVLTTLVLLTFLKMQKQFALLLFWLVVVILFFDLFRFGDKYLSFTPERLLYPETPVISYAVQHAGFDRISGGDAIPMNLWVPYGLTAAEGYDAYYPLRYAQFLALLRGKTDTSALGRYGAIVNYNSELFDFLGVKYLFAQK